MNIYQLIADDHRRLQDILESIEATPPHEHERRINLFSHFRTEIVMHSRTEEEVLYKPVRELAHDEMLIDISMEEHHDIERRVLDIQADSADSEEWIAKVLDLRAVLERHVQKEEQEVFRVAQTLFSNRQAELLADRMLEEKGKLGTEDPFVVIGRRIREMVE